MLAAARGCWPPPRPWSAPYDGAEEAPGVGRRAELLTGAAAMSSAPARWGRGGAELLTGARRCWASSPRRWSAPHDGAAEARVLAGAELLVVAAAAPLSDPSDRRAELLVGVGSHQHGTPVSHHHSPPSSICATRRIFAQAALRDPVFGERERVGF